MNRILVFIPLLLLFSCSSENEVFELELDNLANQKVKLNGIETSKLTAFYFLAPECPLSQNYTKAINDIDKEFSLKGVKFYGVFCGRVYSELEMKTFVDEYNIEIEFLKDYKYQLSEKLKATITPEVFVLDNKGNVVYSGKIDNWAEALGIKRQVVTQFFLKDALNQYLNGETVLVTKTEPVGCILE